MQLVPPNLDPWFIEICRRIRLERSGTGLVARRSTSRKSRINARTFKGVLGDPWAPVHRTKGKSLTLSDRRFSYKMLHRLIRDGDWKRPLCAVTGRSEHCNMLLIAEAFSRGNSKTYGFQSRVIPIPGGLVERFGASEMKDLAEAQIREIEHCDVALHNGLALLAANGDREKKKEYYALTRKASAALTCKASAALICEARAAFDRRADALFFPALWDRVSANEKSNAAQEAARNRFKAQLVREAMAEFDATLQAIPGAAIFRPRAETRARREFFTSLKRAGFEPNHQEGPVLEHA